MARIQWSGGGPRVLKAKLASMEPRILDEGEALVRELAAQAATDQKATLEHAITRTGIRRVESGGQSSDFGSVSPGRVDSGLMINSIESHTEASNGKVVGEWGWFNPEDYFSEQDNGTDKIPAAHSLLTSYIVTRERFLAGMSQLLRGLK